MERKAPFLETELYHAYTRGVDKRIIFDEPRDYERFQVLMLVCNRKGSVDMRSIRRACGGEPFAHLRTIAEELQEDILAEVLFYALMPNHIHLVLRESSQGGISKFMMKLLTSYSMYFNTKHERSGPLFTRPFRSKHVDTDQYLRWLFSYVHLNPLSVLQPGWELDGITDKERAGNYLAAYPYSSYVDYFSEHRPASAILHTANIPLETSELRTFDDLIREYTRHIPEGSR